MNNEEGMPRGKKCFFTGHRDIKNAELLAIDDILRTKIRDCINSGVYIFLVGGATGFDTVAAEAVIEFKRRDPRIKLILYTPGYDQSKVFNMRQKRRWLKIRNNVDYIKYISNDNCNTRGIFARRNKAMADDAGFCIAYCIRKRSGTAQTLNMARRNGTVIFSIMPEQLWLFDDEEDYDMMVSGDDDQL